jgi:hypothetical protein
VALVVTLGCSLDAADHGWINVMSSNEGRVTKPGDTPDVKVNRGKGEATVKHTFVVPQDVDHVDVVFPLWAEGVRGTSTVGSIRYPVE